MGTGYGKSGGECWCTRSLCQGEPLMNKGCGQGINESGCK